MRVRTRPGQPCPVVVTHEYAWDKTTTPYQESAVLHPFDNVSAYYNWTIPAGFNDFVEYCADDTGTDGSFRDCLHTVETNEFNVPLVKMRFNRGWGGNAYIRFLTKSVVDSSISIRTAPNIDMEAYAEQACAFMLPRLQENTSLVNFFLELKDLKHANPGPSLRRVHQRSLTLKSLSDPRTRKTFLKETTTRMNNAHLNAQFGIAPFIRDIAGIYDDLTSLAFRLEQLKRHVNQPQVRHYRRTIPASAGVPASTAWKTSQNTNSWVSGVSNDMTLGGSRPPITWETRGRWVQRPVYHATMRYKYTLPWMGSQYETILSYLETLGVALDPSIIWNAIPFSFVVDWVVDVSGFLSSFRRETFPINVTVSDFCHSYRWHKEAEVHLKFDSDPQLVAAPQYVGSPLSTGFIQVYHGMRSYYSRVRHSPNIHSARLKSPKLRQAALAGSLLLARTAWGNQRRYQDLTRLFYNPEKAVVKPRKGR